MKQTDVGPYFTFLQGTYVVFMKLLALTLNADITSFVACGRVQDDMWESSRTEQSLLDENWISDRVQLD